MRHNKYFTMYDEWLIRMTLSFVGLNGDNKKDEDVIIQIIDYIKPRIKRLRGKK